MESYCSSSCTRKGKIILSIIIIPLSLLINEIEGHEKNVSIISFHLYLSLAEVFISTSWPD